MNRAQATRSVAVNRLRLLAALGACLAAVAACSVGGPAAPLPVAVTTTPASVAPAPTTPDATPVPAAATSTVLSSGGIDLAIEAPVVLVAPEADGSAVATVTAVAASVPDARVARLSTPPGTVVTVRPDGSADLRAADGTFVGGLAAPAVLPAGTGQSARYSSVEDGVVDLVIDVGEPGVEVRVWFGTSIIASAEWGEREGGRSLAVVPTSWARAGGAAAVDGGLESLAALVPEASTPGMQDQFRCHAVGAPDKASWNLEPWRPDVGLVATLIAACNP